MWLWPCRSLRLLSHTPATGRLDVSLFVLTGPSGCVGHSDTQQQPSHVSRSCEQLLVFFVVVSPLFLRLPFYFLFFITSSSAFSSSPFLLRLFFPVCVIVGLCFNLCSFTPSTYLLSIPFCFSQRMFVCLLPFFPSRLLRYFGFCCCCLKSFYVLVFPVNIFLLV